MIRGAPIPLPDLSSYGCTLVPAGKKMTWWRANGVPVVSVTARNGVVVTGVTAMPMISIPPETATEKQARYAKMNADRLIMLKNDLAILEEECRNSDQTQKDNEVCRQRDEIAAQLKADPSNQ